VALLNKDNNDVDEIPIGTGITIFACAFGAWAWVVAWGVTVIRREVSELKSEVRVASAEAHESRVHIEGRIAHLEAVAAFCRKDHQ
jgi:predicted amino acid racemase